MKSFFLSFIGIVATSLFALEPPPLPTPAAVAPPTEAPAAEAKKPTAEGRTASEGALLQPSDTLDVVPAKDFLELHELDQIPVDAFRWDPNSARFLYIPKDNKTAPYIFLLGRMRPGFELMFEDKWVEHTNGSFQIPLPLKFEFMPLELKFFRGKTGQPYRVLLVWKKLPPGLGPTAVSDQLAAQSAYVQLYLLNSPTLQADLDSSKHSHMTFRVFPAPIQIENYEGWTLSIRLKGGAMVKEVHGTGKPPVYIPWEYVQDGVARAGSYEYQLNLYANGQIFRGKPNYFEATEGLSLISYPYLPQLAIEPKAELGYYSFSNRAGLNYAGAYIGSEVTLVGLRRFLLRTALANNVHSIDPTASYSFIRLGVGYRIFGDLERTAVKTFIFRIDTLVNYAAFTISPYAPLRRYSAPSILIEPHLVFLDYHYIVPWVEFAARAGMDHQRISIGMQYQIYIRPWQVRLGIGISDDSLYRLDDDPSQVFHIFRTQAMLSFFL